MRCAAGGPAVRVLELRTQLGSCCGCKHTCCSMPCPSLSGHAHLQIATTADDATVKVWHIQRQQAEEQADDDKAAEPWQPWWRQASQVQAAAAAAAAYQGVGQEAPAGSATPGTALGCATAAMAGGLGAATPWSSTGMGGSSSASMLAALRTQGGTAGPSAGPHGTTPLVAAGQDENAHANHRPQQGAAGPAEHQQQQAGGSRLASFMTPFAPAGATPAGTGSPAAGTRTVRRIGKSTAGLMGGGLCRRELGCKLRNHSVRCRQEQAFTRPLAAGCCPPVPLHH